MNRGWVTVPVNVLECTCNYARKKAKLGIKSLNVTAVIGPLTRWVNIYLNFHLLSLQSFNCNILNPLLIISRYGSIYIITPSLAVILIGRQSLITCLEE